MFVGNGLVAIFAGLFANYLVDNLKLGPVAPFDASACVLLLGGAGEHWPLGRWCSPFIRLYPMLLGRPDFAAH